jgi:hypothetical protein
MTQSFEEIRQMLKEREKQDLKSREIKQLIREVNRETDGIERQGADCFTGLLYGNGEEAEDYDTLESSI